MVLDQVFLWKNATVKRVSENKFNAYYNGEFVGMVLINRHNCTYNDQNTMSQAVKSLVLDKKA